MFKQLDFKVIGGIVIIAVFLVAGIHFYSKWSYNRFATEIGAVPQSTSPSEGASKKSDTNTPSEQSKPTQSPKSANKNLKVESKLIDKSELTNTVENKEATAEKTESPEFDALSMFSALFDEDAEEADFERAQEHFTETYGESPEVEAIIDRLKQMEGVGRVSLDDITALIEAWIQVLPEDQQENRQELMGMLTDLNQAKAQGITSMHVVVDPDLDPSLLEGE